MVILDWMYDQLVVHQEPDPADLIFVLAGLPERKRYRWELFQRGMAPQLLLSVGRKEAPFLKAQTGLPEDGNIVELLPLKPGDGNHLFLWATQQGVYPKIVRLPELNTFGEIVALRGVIRQHRIRRVLVVSTDVHFRRIQYAVNALLGVSQPRIAYLAVPQAMSTCHRDRWWSRGWDTQLVLEEWLKLAGYRLKYEAFRWHQRYAESQSLVGPPGTGNQ
jgi:hypothetical protein